MHLLLSMDAILIKIDYTLVYEENIIKFHKVDIQQRYWKKALKGIQSKTKWTYLYFEGIMESHKMGRYSSNF